MSTQLPAAITGKGKIADAARLASGRYLSGGSAAAGRRVESPRSVVLGCDRALAEGGVAVAARAAPQVSSRDRR